MEPCLFRGRNGKWHLTGGRATRLKVSILTAGSECFHWGHSRREGVITTEVRQSRLGILWTPTWLLLVEYELAPRGGCGN